MSSISEALVTALQHHRHGRLQAAELLYRQILQAEPNQADALHLLGVLVHQAGKDALAVEYLNRAIQLKGDAAPYHNNLGRVHHALGNIAEAAACCRRALELEPDYTEAHKNLGMYLLSLGHYEEGWREYEHRRTPGNLSKPRWQGGPAHGRTILICCEQGFGDVFQLLRYTPLVRQRSGAQRIVLATDPTLARLLTQNPDCGAEIAPCLTVTESSLPHFDEHVPLLSLPLALGAFEPLPMTKGGYVRADPELRREWRERLGPASALRVGLVWAGSATHPLDRLRSLAPESLLPILRIPGFQFYSLQVGRHGDEANPLAAAGLLDLTGRLTDFADTAGLIAELDLIISVDTGVAHLAGAMSRPVWTFLPFVPDWRWGLQGETTPWYPTMRLFRQPRANDWDSVLKRLGVELASDPTALARAALNSG